MVLGVIIKCILLAILIASIIYLFVNTPSFPRGDVSEGFYGGVAIGSGNPGCSRILAGSAELLDSINIPMKCSDILKSDYSELELILSKLGCLKQDLMSPSGIVDATRYQPYETSHDIEQVSEVAATCLNTSIPSRDLDIIFGKWRDRTLVLLKRLSIAGSLSEKQTIANESLFMGAWNDVYEVAKGRCLKQHIADDMTGGPAPRTPENVIDLRSYSG